MRISLMLFLMVSSCTTTPAYTSPPVHWEIIDLTPYKSEACLPMDDVKTLTETLVRLQAAAAKCN